MWAGGKVSSQRAAALDRSNNTTSADRSDTELEQSRATYLPSEGDKPLWEVEEEEAKEFAGLLQDNVNINSSSSSAWSKSFLGSVIQSITGGKVLETEELEPVMAQMKEILHEKNVAVEIATDICDSVLASLVGHQMQSFTRIQTVVLESLCDAVQRVLTPKTSIDILRQILDSRAKKQVYSIVFVGINGVGKSTSLAKVAYYLKQHGIKVLLAACDTFRSGAVEQLRTHSRCLDAHLFEMGYAKDPSSVAKAAISYALEHGFDCVLIDTAGRMQNNEPLMRALAKLVGDIEPNQVFFVGEALVGNDGIDQLTMFNRALGTFSPPGFTYGINGIILTKFDTIDDKVGAALSMSYKSGAPIVFVGTGQKYTHLRKLNVHSVINHLFSKS